MQTDEPTLGEVIDEAAGVLAKFIVPLYVSDSKSRPSSYGTGFFVRVGERHFLVSAGHVLETLKTRPLFYYVASGITRKLSGRLLLNPWEGDRENDLVDVGVLRLSNEGLPPYPEVNKFALNVSCLRPGLLPRSGKNYIIIGFPASRSEVNPMAREVAATVYGYRNTSLKDSAYSEHGLTPESNLVLPSDLEVGFDSSGKHRNFPKPQGMSGSPVWVLYDEGGEDDSRMFQVVAVGTKYWKKERLLVGTDIAVVLDMINAAV